MAGNGFRFLQRCRIVLLGVAVAAGLVALGCGSAAGPQPGDGSTDPGEELTTRTDEESDGNTDSGGKRYGGVLRILNAVPRSPIGTPWEIIGISVNTATPALEALIRLDRNNVVHPWLAEHWELTPERDAFIFELRQGVRFHDGTEFDADAVVWNLNKQIEAQTLPMVDSVEALDRYTVRVNLNSFDNTIYTLLGGTRGLMISPTAFEQNGLEWARWNPVGTGPFKIVEYERDVVARYERFEDYWDEGKPYLDGVEMHIIVDHQTRKAAFLAGEVDFLSASLEVATELMDQGYPADTNLSWLWAMHPSSADPDSPFADPRVRMAVSHAIDREALVEVRTFGMGAPAYQAAHPDIAAYLPDYEGYPYDPARAKELLVEAGYPQGFETRLISTESVDRDTLVILQQFLNAVGIQTAVEQVPNTRYQEYINGGWTGLLFHQLGRFGNYNAFVRQYWFLNQRFVSWERPPGLEEAFEASMATPEAEPARVQELNRLLIEDLHLIPVFYSPAVYVMKPNVRDVGHLTWYTSAWWSPADAWLADE